MKKILFTVIVLMVIGSNVVADDGLTVNGRIWNNWDERTKIYFLLGWMKCGLSASNNMLVKLGSNDGPMEYQRKVYIDEGVIIGGTSIGQLRLTLDSIYADTRVTYIDIEAVMPFAIGRLNSGWTLEQLDRVISYKIRIDKCQEREMAIGKIVDECSSLRKERNGYISKLRN